MPRTAVAAGLPAKGDARGRFAQGLRWERTCPPKNASSMAGSRAGPLPGRALQFASARSAAQQRFHDAELACWRRFAVNDCVRKARVERRTAMDQLRQEELLLNEMERQRRTAERLRQLEQKQQKAAP